MFGPGEVKGPLDEQFCKWSCGDQYEKKTRTVSTH